MTVLLFIATAAISETHNYAVIVGVNEAPAGKGALVPLRYADDDAARYARFFAEISASTVHVLSAFDGDTSRRYTAIAAHVRPPTLPELRSALRDVAAAVKADRAAGIHTVFYFAYSGHGARNSRGAMALTLLDGDIDRALLFSELVDAIGAHDVHVMIDACHAEAVVLGRGTFDHESNGQVTSAVPEQTPLPPNVGLLLASASQQESHEWSLIESGVFTHELLSGLRGPADVNLDGRIEYSEIQAFMASANRNLKDPRSVPALIATPPRATPRATLIDLAQISSSSTLEGDASALGHFSIELENGERLLDANLSGRVKLYLPSAARAFLRTADAEAEIDAPSFGDLRMQARATATRGSIAEDLRTALFSAAFGVSYYRGFVDSVGVPSVPFEDASADAHLTRPWRKPAAIAAFTLGGAALAASAALFGVAVAAKQEFDRSPYQRVALDAANRFDFTRNLTIATAIGAAVAAGVGLALWPWAPRFVLLPTGSGLSAVATLSY